MRNNGVYQKQRTSEDSASPKMLLVCCAACHSLFGNLLVKLRGQTGYFLCEVAQQLPAYNQRHSV